MYTVIIIIIMILYILINFHSLFEDCVLMHSIAEINFY